MFGMPLTSSAPDVLKATSGWLLLRSDNGFVIVKEGEVDIFSILKPTIHFDHSLPASAENPYIVTFEAS